MVKKFDDTKEAREIRDVGRQKMMHSIGLLVSKRHLRGKDASYFEIFGVNSLRADLEGREGSRVSDEFKYLNQACMVPAATFFMIDKNLMMGAGHAMWKDDNNTEDPKDWCILFDWWAEKDARNEWHAPRQVPKANVFDIARIIALTVPTKYGKRYGQADFAIIELARHVPDERPAFEFATTKPQKGTPCWAGGYPFGLPLKISRGEIAQAPETPVEGKDAFSYEHTMLLRAGNSGCPVLNMDNQVIAICARGWEDYKLSSYSNEIVPVIRTEGKTLDSLMRTDSIRLLLRPDVRVQIIMHVIVIGGKLPVPITLDHSPKPRTYETLSEGFVGDSEFVSFDCNLNGRRPLDIANVRVRVMTGHTKQKPAKSLHISSMRMIISDVKNPRGDRDERFEAWYNYGVKKDPVNFDVSLGGTHTFSFRDVAAEAGIMDYPIWSTPTFPAGRHQRDTQLAPARWPRP